MQEVAQVEAEAQEIYAENQQLNKQQSALNAEVCILPLPMAYFLGSRSAQFAL